MIPENFQTNIKARTFTGKRLSKISEEIEPEMIVENAEDVAEDITEVINEDKTEEITEENIENKTENGIVQIPEGRIADRKDDRTDDTGIIEDTSGGSREEIHDDKNVSEDSTGSTAQTIRVGDNNQIESLEMNLPFGKFGKSFIMIIVFAGIGSLVTIEIHTRMQNRLNVDDPRKFFKVIIAL